MATLLELQARLTKAQAIVVPVVPASRASTPVVGISYPDWLKAIDALVRAAWSRGRLEDEGYDGIEALPDFDTRTMWKAGMSPVEALQHASKEWAAAAVKAQVAQVARGDRQPVQATSPAVTRSDQARNYGLGRIPVGTRVLFGRQRGEQTLGEIVSVGSARYKIRQMEPRGSLRDYPVGSLWNIPFRLATVEGVLRGASVVDEDDEDELDEEAGDAGDVVGRSWNGIPIGKVFASRSRQFRVVGFKPGRPVYPVVAARIPDGKRFKFMVSTVKSAPAKPVP